MFGVARTVSCAAAILKCAKDIVVDVRPIMDGRRSGMLLDAFAAGRVGAFPVYVDFQYCSMRSHAARNHSVRLGAESANGAWCATS
jgi:hypothetical protein